MTTNTDLYNASRLFMDSANRLPTLYDLSSDFFQLIALLEDPEQDTEAIQQEMERVARDIKAKGYGIAAVIITLERLAEVQKAEADRLTAKSKRNQSHADRLRSYALSVMQATPGLARLETGSFTLSIRNNPPAVQVVDPAQVPKEFERTKITVDIDKRAVLDFFKATGAIPDGINITRGQRLSID